MFRLTDESAKLRLLATTGLDGAIVLTFDAALAGFTAEEFVSRILLERFAMRGAVIGFNFHFGKGRAGTPAFLTAEGERHGFSVDIVPPLADSSRIISSGPIREALMAGGVAEAAELLGYAWFVSGSVAHGDKRGRELASRPPTSSSTPPARCGTASMRCAPRSKERYDGVANFRRRPMLTMQRAARSLFI